MDCKELNNNIWNYLDNNASEELLEKIHSHASTCSDCEKILTRLQKTDSYIKKVKNTECPPYLIDRINLRLENKKPGKKVTTGNLYIRYASIAASIAFIIVLGTSIGNTLANYSINSSAIDDLEFMASSYETDSNTLTLEIE